MNLSLLIIYESIPGPNSVLNITPVIDSTNVTLEWPRPEGRIETYVIRWWPVENSEDVRSKNVSESNDATGILYDENAVQKVLVSDLMPGVQYSFSIYTVSYNLVSDVTNLTTRTSKCNFQLFLHIPKLRFSFFFFQLIIQVFH